jgi:hypothetical protein
LHPEAGTVFQDTYLLEFLDLPPEHSEADLQRGLVEKLKQLLIDLGRDFCFIGSYYPIQVGGRDFEIDLLFFNRALNCLVASELKIEEFQPAHLGQLQFYLEALDQDVRKPHEAPSIAVLLCTTKDHEVVEYALSRVALDLLGRRRRCSPPPTPERVGVARTSGGSCGPVREEWSASLFASEAGFASDLCPFRLAKI